MNILDGIKNTWLRILLKLLVLIAVIAFSIWMTKLVVNSNLPTWAKVLILR